MSVVSRLLWKQIDTIKMLLALLAMGLFIFTLFIRATRYFNLRSLDGAFQSLTLVRAVERGDVLGADFFPYLSPLIGYLLYPIYAVMGGDLFAITTSAYALSFVAISLTVVCLAQLSRIDSALALSAITLALFTAWYFPVEVSLTDLHMPGNSLRSIRWMLPYAIALALWGAYNRQYLSGISNGVFHRFRILLLWAVFAGLSLYWSPDAGIPSILALVLVWPFFDAIWTKGPNLFLRWFAMCAIAVLVAYAFGSAVSRGNLGTWLRHLFVELPHDQFWYFGYWEEFLRVYSVRDIFSNVLANPITSLTLPIGIMALRLLLTPAPSELDRVRRKLLAFVALSASGTATITQIGGVTLDSYALPVVLPFLFLSLFTARELLFQPDHSSSIALPDALQKLVVGSVFLIGVGLMTALMMRTLAYEDPRPREFVPELGLYVPAREAAFLEPFRKFAAAADTAGLANRERIFPIYLSANEEVAGATLPSPYGMTIHALGEDARAAHLDAFLARQYPIVTTINPEYDVFAYWNERSSWYLFREIVTRYMPFAKTRQHILWRPRSVALEIDDTALACDLRPVPTSDLDSAGTLQNRKQIVVTGGEVGAPTVYAEISVVVSLSREPGGLLPFRDRMLLTAKEAQSALPLDTNLVSTHRDVRPAYWRRVAGDTLFETPLFADGVPDLGRRYGVARDSGPVEIVAPHAGGTETRLVLESRPSDRTSLELSECMVRAIPGYIAPEELPVLTRDAVLPIAPRLAN